MKKKIRHSWSAVPGWFRKWQCWKCNAVKQWDKDFKCIVYYEGNGNGPFYKTPSCIDSCCTNVH